jgi:hypothetical protein
MNAGWLLPSYSDEDFGTDQWRRRMLFEHIQTHIREQQRARFLGQLFLMGALIASGAMLYWACQALGFDVAINPRELDRWTTVAIAALGIAALGLAIILWDARLRLGRAELRLLQRDLDRALSLDQTEQ